MLMRGLWILLLCMGAWTLGSLSMGGCVKKTYPYDTCEQDPDCKGDQICRGGRCESVDLTCRVNGDCVGGRLCIKAKCQHVICQDDRDCEAGERCQGGYCLTSDPDGVSVPPEGRSAPEPSTTDGGEAIPSDAPPQERSQPQICTPNRDGKIDRSELLFRVGTSVTYRLAGSQTSPVTVDLNGKNENGTTTWDFSQNYPNSTKVVDEILSVQGTWYAPEFANATYTSLLDPTQKLFGVFQATQTDLLLLGVASEAKDSTKLKYDKPISLFRFPLELGQKWTSNGTTKGTLLNVPFYSMHESYVFEVDAKGSLKTAAGSFPVVRLKLSLTQQQTSPTFFRKTGYSYYFVAECYGVIATITSKTYETNPLFTQAASVKILSD